MKKLMLILVCVSLVFALGSMALADEVTDTIGKATSLYSGGKYSQALTELNYAISQIHNLMIEQYKQAFPEARPGFTAEDFSSQAAGAALLGGGITVSRNYNKANGGNVYVETVSDSPMLSFVTSLMTNPMFISGEKQMITIGGEKAIKEWSDADNSGELQIVIANRVLLTVRGSDVSFDEVKAYAEAYNYTLLKKFLAE